MTANGTHTEPPPSLRRFESPAASGMAVLCATFEDLQTVLRCCELLVGFLAPPEGEEAAHDATDPVVVEALWTAALLSYARCFVGGTGEQDGGATAPLTEDDVAATHPGAEVLEWHRVILRLRDHYADRAVNPRERFSVGVAQGADGAATGVAVTSIRQPLVDELTVRQLGGIVYALSEVVDTRIAAGQAELFTEVQDVSPADLAKLTVLDLAAADAPRE
jgi:hypothetical protein